MLAVAALARAILETARPVLLGLGHSRADFALKVAQAALMIALVLLLGSMWGTPGVAWAVLTAAVATLPVWAALLLGTAGLRAADLFMPFAAPLVATAAGIAALAALPPADTTWSDVIGHVAAFVLAYGLASLVLYRALPASGISLGRRGLA